MASITAMILSFLAMVCTVLAAMMPMAINAGCAPSSPLVKTLTYTQWQAPQIAPTSTVYQMIVTHIDYIVWCSHGAATVTNAQANPVNKGPYTAKVTSSVLTVEEVGCIQSGTVLTRREIRGNEYFKRTVNKKDVEAPATISAGGPASTHPQRNSYLAGIPFPIPKGWKRNHEIHQTPAEHMKAKRQHVTTSLTPAAALLVSELQSAQYALELCNSDFNLTEICIELRDPAAIQPLANVGVNANQAGDIVCFCSVYGIDLNTTNAALLGDLAAAIYGLELGDNFTTTTNTTKLCNTIDLAAAPYLGIDAGAVNNYICGAPATSVTVTAVLTQTVVVVPGEPTATFTASGTGFMSDNTTTTFTASNIGSVGDNATATLAASGAGTGAPNEWPNGTYPQYTQYTGGNVGVAGTAVSGGAAPTGGSNSWGNWTGTDSIGIEFPQSSSADQDDTPKTPMARDVQQYYPATTMEAVPTTFGRYD